VPELPNKQPANAVFTWANGLTLVRLLAIGPAAWAIFTGHWILASSLFVLAVITDMADGPLARRLDHASAFGGLFDHATDALFVSTSLAALAWTGFINLYLPPLVAFAFLQYVFDSRALAGAELRTSLIGRYNGIAYFVMVGIPVFRETLGLSWPADSWIAALAWLLVASTGISMLERGILFIRRR
jgi:phosphatidylglycerophosphate synthase